MNAETMAHPTRPYTTTHSGRHITTLDGVPSILDIAIGASRVTRFAGQGKQFFSVLAHMMWMDDLYCAHLANQDPAIRLAILLHDAHEAVTSDIPSPLKTGQQKVLQEDLDKRIFNRYYHIFGGFNDFVASEAQKAIKDLDYRTLVAEYWEVGPAQPCYLDYARPEDRDYFRWWLEKKQPLWADESAAQTNYVHRMLYLL